MNIDEYDDSNRKQIFDVILLFLEKSRPGIVEYYLCECLFRQFNRSDSIRNRRTDCCEYIRLCVRILIEEKSHPYPVKSCFSAPFDSAIISFIAMCVLLITSWSENYGDANAPVSQSFISAWHAIKSGK